MKPKRHHFKFERRFVEDVRAFRKHCTIRAKRKRLARPGDIGVFSYWSEAAYRSPSVPIGESELTNVTPIKIEAETVPCECAEPHPPDTTGQA